MALVVEGRAAAKHVAQRGIDEEFRAYHRQHEHEDLSTTARAMLRKIVEGEGDARGKG